MFNESIREEIKAQGAAIEKLGTLPDDLLQFAYEEKLFKCFVPVELGGKMLELPEAVRVFQEASALDGSFGWLVAIGSGGNAFVPNFKEETCRELFSPKEAVIAGSAHSTAIAVKENGGYRVTGEWRYCSGAPYASMFTANSKLEGTEEIVTCIFTPDQVDVIQDWDAFGLKGTGSHTIRVENAFVPIVRTFDLMKNANEFGDIVHTFPFVQFGQSSFTAVSLGIGQGFFEEARRILEANKEQWSKDGNDKYEAITSILDEELVTYDQIEGVFYSTLQEIWQTHKDGEMLEEADLNNFSKVCKEAADTTIGCANRLFRHFGMEAVMESSDLNRIWRNLHTASQHTFLTP
ncbi:acyl-CoA dehydrogenase family protein [Sporosarcina siberiensis]|uniref:Acyl-CoA dehydrogenase family protein n=1 Tax=Sporosarcina siberiensis TaxID=1365606 RepID=A0ABW4SKA8_9BACL